MSERDRGAREAWVEAVDRRWRPEPLDEAGRARFDARLGERLDIARPWAPVWLVPAPRAVAVLALAALAALASLSGWGFGPAETSPFANPPPVTADTQLADTADTQLAAWEWDLLLGDELGDENRGALPEEYSAIASAFLNR